jgi:hypothetical protein
LKPYAFKADSNSSLSSLVIDSFVTISIPSSSRATVLILIESISIDRFPFSSDTNLEPNL